MSLAAPSSSDEFTFPAARQRWDLSQWLDYLTQLHPKGIAMGLERTRAVAERLALDKPAKTVITVAGTNGKGSTVAFLQALLMATGLRIGCYTSPHVLNFSERIFLADESGQGRWASDAELINAFVRIDQARAEIPLTFFEFTTLAAWVIFAEQNLDAVVLEVGLGGRLDAVNVIDADGVILTTVDLDHQEYLGSTRAEIGMEKAGVFRALQTTVYADREAVAEVLRFAEKIGLSLIRPRLHYQFQIQSEQWRFRFNDQSELLLPKPTLAANCQFDNAAAALALRLSLSAPLGPISVDQIAQALVRARLPGRLAKVGEAPEIYLDVAHNPQAAQSLALWLQQNPPAGRVRAVFGGLEDKDVLSVLMELKSLVHHWYLAGLDGQTPRGLSAMALTARVRGATGGHYDSFIDPKAALDAAISAAQAQDRILLFGSFYMVEQAYRALGFDSLPAFNWHTP